MAGRATGRSISSHVWKHAFVLTCAQRHHTEYTARHFSSYYSGDAHYPIRDGDQSMKHFAEELGAEPSAQRATSSKQRAI
jgi:hypothetical protein